MGKRLGQHFLRSKSLLRIIANISDVPDNHFIVEIGPGKGALTEFLLKRSSNVIAIEKDPVLFELIKDRFSSEIACGSLKVYCDNAEDLNWLAVIGSSDYSVISNIPYYLTGVLIKKILSCEKPPKSMTLVVQKEVAERIAVSGKESLLSLSVKFFGKPKYIKTIKRSFFSPAPKVDSAILSITDIQSRSENQSIFFDIIHTAFHEKRKSFLKKFKDEYVKSLFKSFGVTEKTRAEDVPFETWMSVYTRLKESGE